MRQINDPKGKKDNIALKYSLYTKNSKNITFFKTIEIYVNLKSCGCIITRENKSVGDTDTDNDTHSDENIDILVTELFFWNVGRYSIKSLINKKYVRAKLSMKYMCDPETCTELKDFQYFMQLFFTQKPKTKTKEAEAEDKDQKPKAKYQLYDTCIPYHVGMDSKSTVCLM